MGRRVKQRLTMREKKLQRDAEKAKLAPMPENYFETDMTIVPTPPAPAEPGSLLYEQQKEEEANKALQKPIGPHDSTQTIVDKCRFQDSVKYEYSPVDNEMLEHLLPSRRRSRRRRRA